MIHYVPDVISYFRRFSRDEGFRIFSNNLSKEDYINIQTSLLFSVSGRESDIGFSDNPNFYKAYRKNSAKQFSEFLERFKIDKGIRWLYKPLVLHLGDPNFEPINDEKMYLFHIMNLAHKLDLQRCYVEKTYCQSIDTMKKLVIASNDQEVALSHLFQKVTDSIQITGDRLLCAYNNKEQKIVSCGKGYESPFEWVSSSPDFCLSLLNGVTGVFNNFEHTIYNRDKSDTITSRIFCFFKDAFSKSGVSYAIAEDARVSLKN